MSDLAAVVRFVHVTAAVLLTGGFSFTLLIARPAFRRTGSRSLTDFAAFLNIQFFTARWCCLAILASALLGLWIQTVNVGQASADASFALNTVFPLLAETQYGKVWLARMLLALILAALLWFDFHKPNSKDAVGPVALGFPLSACLLATLALAGHASAAEGMAFVLQVSADALHLLASGIWLGGLAPLAALLRACNRKGDAGDVAVAGAATQRFSFLALVCAAIVITTGGYNAWNLVGGFAPLFGTAYGKLLLLKVGLLLPLLGVAAVNLLRLKPRIVKIHSFQREETAAHLKRLTRNVTIEILLGVTILLIVGFMSITPPARHIQPDWPFSFRWDWSVVDKAPQARADMQRAFAWAAIGGIALLTALVRRRRRMVTAVVGLGVLSYAGTVMLNPVSTDAYPTTYKRPAVAYQAISVANGKNLYEDSSCAVCHGPGGYGDGPLASELRPKPADLTAPHANAHTAGDLFWWLSHGVKKTAMPGFSESLSEEERWDLINFMRALSSGDRARALAPVIEPEPWLVAPDFTYATNAGEAKTLRDHRGVKIVLLVLLDLKNTDLRLKELANALPHLQSANVEIIVTPHILDQLYVSGRFPALIVSEGIREISETYKLFARSFSDESLIASPRHVEFLIDKQGYIRARWLPAENDAWQKIDALLEQVELLRKEKPRAPAPDEHVH